MKSSLILALVALSSQSVFAFSKADAVLTQTKADIDCSQFATDAECQATYEHSVERAAEDAAEEAAKAVAKAFGYHGNQFPVEGAGPGSYHNIPAAKYDTAPKAQRGDSGIHDGSLSITITLPVSSFENNTKYTYRQKDYPTGDKVGTIRGYQGSETVTSATAHR